MSARNLRNVAKQTEQRELYQRWAYYSGKHKEHSANERLRNNVSTVQNGKQAHLYVMKYENCFPGCYKVGRTSNFENRLKSINGGHMARLMYVAQYEKLGHLELLIHDELAPYRVQCGSREWFAACLGHIERVIKTIAGTCICFK